ncbi:MAG: SURF1 family protein [Burkholderiaceae bacterium]
MKRRRGSFALVVVATVLTMAVTAALGVWQLGRAAGKQALYDQIESRALRPALDAAALLASPSDDEFLHRHVRLQGRWVPGHTVFLDNRQMEGRPGFYVVTPLRLDGSQRAVLIQRGWVPRDFQDRSHLPPVPTPDGPVEILGRLSPPPAKLYEFGEAESGAIRQNIDLAALAAETGLDLLPMSVVQLKSGSDDGLSRDWPRVESGVARHHGYAFQWFGLCALTAFLFVWFQIIAPRRSTSSHESKP